MVVIFFTSTTTIANGKFYVTNNIQFTTTTPIYYANFINEWPLWTLPIVDLRFNGSSLGANGIGVIDSASTYLRMPVVYSNFIAQQISAVPQSTSEGTRYIIPNCDRNALPNITLSIAGDLYNLTGPGYAKSLTGTDCMAQFLGSDDVYDATPIWRLGAPFFAAARTHLNFTTNTIILTGN